MSRRTNRRNELLVGGLVLLAGLLFTWMAIQVGALKALGNSITVTARFDDAAGLVPDAAVKVAGVKIGAVRGLAVDFDEAVVTLVLDADAGIRSDVKAQVRARSLLGEKYVALVPKSRDAALLEDGGTIENTVPAIDIDDLLRSVGPLLSQVDPDDVAVLVAAAGKVLEAAEAEAPELLEQANRLLATLNDAAEIVPTLKAEVPAAVADLRTTARRLQGTIDTVDQLLGRADGLVTGVDGAVQDGDALIAELRAVVDELEPGLDDLRAAMEQSDEALAGIRAVLKNVEGLDAEAVRTLLREEGVLVRLRPPKPGRD